MSTPSSFVCRLTFNDGMGAKSFDVFEKRSGGLKVGEVHAAAPGRWSWVDRDGGSHRNRYGYAGTRADCLWELDQWLRDHPDLCSEGATWSANPAEIV